MHINTHIHTLVLFIYIALKNMTRLLINKGLVPAVITAHLTTSIYIFHYYHRANPVRTVTLDLKYLQQHQNTDAGDLL
jgi:hypothetical protein